MQILTSCALRVKIGKKSLDNMVLIYMCNLALTFNHNLTLNI